MNVLGLLLDMSDCQIEELLEYVAALLGDVPAYFEECAA